MTQKPSGIGSLDAYSCPYITVFDILNIPNASSLLLVCARIAIAVGVLWFCLKPGRFQAREFSRWILGTGVLRCLAHHKQFMIINRVRQVDNHTHLVFPHHTSQCLTSHTLCKRQLCACLHTFPLCEPSRIMVYIANFCVLPTVCAVTTWRA